MQAILRANVRYVRLLLDSLSGQAINLVDYKLARKDIFVTSANLGAAFDRMLSEPKHKQRNEKLIYEFVVLNYVLSANVATITSARLAGKPGFCPASYLRPVKRALFTLTDSLNSWTLPPKKRNRSRYSGNQSARVQQRTILPCWNNYDLFSKSAAILPN